MVLGIDEAGRGAAVGPLVITGVITNILQEQTLKEWGVKDSKMYTSDEKRFSVAKNLQHMCTYCTVKFSAADITKMMKDGVSLNEIERIGAKKIIETIVNKYRMQPHAIVIDGEFFYPLKDWIFKNTGVSDFKAVNKADQDYISVAAASVIAKSTRDLITKSIMGNYFNTGKGYPNPGTEKWVREVIGVNHHIRQTWEWWIKLEKVLENEGKESLSL